VASRAPVTTAVLVVVGVVVLATAGLLGTLDDEVVRIAAVVAPEVLPPLPVFGRHPGTC